MAQGKWARDGLWMESAQRRARRYTAERVYDLSCEAMWTGSWQCEKV